MFGSLLHSAAVPLQVVVTTNIAETSITIDDVEYAPWQTVKANFRLVVLKWLTAAEALAKGSTFRSTQEERIPIVRVPSQSSSTIFSPFSHSSHLQSNQFIGVASHQRVVCFQRAFLVAFRA